ncbi:sugar porter family MFS transporter [Arenibacter sp. F20364]|uniref:sugar porter family MFS transporter n=1 Tax=Arenibacter sp. F20364 TaxID=2926415 RepID=UPI001FF1056B|nr:sugar porter family MFS transporter [Arenibacter sp. F20364]MCK0191568.1 sugar porter family MFS transporter [Arenibacter sp. F20364]|tara:strand:- start:2258 stop:3601 length:1344 start_codon:yes stop_codon:yes gene_type:complete
MKKSEYLLKITLIGALGGLLFGYDTAVISGAIGFIESKFSLNADMKGWAVSSAILGCIFGVAIAGYIADRIGRKKALIITAILFAVSAIGCALAETFSQLVIARIVGGIGVGAASMLSPLYISEIAPAHKRGMLVSLYQLAIVVGINIVFFLNYIIAGLYGEQWNVDMGWRFMLGSETIPAVLFLIALFFVPESPRWLTKEGRDEEALDILTRINTKEIAQSVHKDIKLVLGQEKGTLKELFAPGLRVAMIVGVILALFSQITGINAIMYYAPEILKDAGFGVDSALMQTVIIGVINTIFTFVAIMYIDKLGRRTLLLWGVSGMILCLLGIGTLFYLGLTTGPWVLILILGFVGCFGTSLGPIPWVLISEIFPTKTRGIAMSLSIMVLWIGVWFISQFTPVLLDKIGGAFTFWLFMINAIILLIFTYKMIPETKGKTLEEIEMSWKK